MLILKGVFIGLKLCFSLLRVVVEVIGMVTLFVFIFALKGLFSRY